ncbi:MAG TPA: hypothetical protein VEQ63_14620, partial [Bryobacteraceae bacterium]|nr:hypothetical protein [Bryobacteraceae bacterium]
MAWLVFLLAATGIASAQSSEASLAKQSAAAEKQFAAAAKQGSGFERKPQAFSGFTSTWYSLAQDPKLQTAWISVPDCEPLASEDLNKM